MTNKIEAPGTIDREVLAGTRGGQTGPSWCDYLGTDVSGRATAYFDSFPKAERDKRYEAFRKVNTALCDYFDGIGQHPHAPDAPRD